MSSSLQKGPMDQRPPKRPRTQTAEEPPAGPVDHIFIADGVSAKKAGVKKTPLSCCECRRLKLKVCRSCCAPFKTG
ncbi:hypothetical protein FA15DRAFT_464906 [Coprinopsis marcescibilis]|uniref:Zn(2)-C6 fungal-type domain-containing protein n=1 Tax=Coprinopsis marcescibilis TaxID=230819 RepID=A0A5C3KS37_COPMA|nr:hypothetical protein FA15DRAFT_464906 [Coprinopsis marcescibilis]